MFTVVLVLAGIIGVLVIVISLRPSEFRVTRSAVLPGAAASVFPHVNELRKWEAWSPWARLDPNAKSTFEGPAAGAGASMVWAGNRNVGEGRMTILESRLDELVRFKLEFFKPMQGVNTAEFTFKAQGSETLVTWSMFGPNSFMGKAIGLFIDCEKMVGSQFEQGLANLKAVLEAAR